MKRGDGDACTHLVAHYDRQLKTFIGRIVDNRDDVADIAQETWMRVFRSIDRYDTNRRFASWCFSIARRAAIDHWRKLRHTITSNSGQEDADGIGFNLKDPYNDAGEHELSEEMETVLADPRMNTKIRSAEILQKYEVQGMSVDEIAEGEGRSRNTILWRITEARRTLRVIWNSRDSTPDPHRPSSRHSR